MQFPTEFDDFKKVTDQAAQDVAKAVTAGMDDISRGFTLDLREQVVAAGLGSRLANTWRGRRYPDGGRVSMDAAAFVWSKAADIIDSFARGATITTVNGRRYLALPTENCPARVKGEGGKGRFATPAQVETLFNQDLKFAKAGGTGRLLAYVNVIGAKNKKGFRAATPKRIAQGRQAAAVVMFIMVPIVRMPKLLAPDDLFRSWSARVPDAISAHWRF